MLGRAAVGDDALDRGQPGANRPDLRLGLPAAADHAQRARSTPGEMLRRDAARGSGPSLPGRIGFEHGCELAGAKVEERDGEEGASSGSGVGLDAGVAELAVDRGHDCEAAVVESEPPPRYVLDGATRHPEQARLHHRHRLSGRDQAGDVTLGQVERQAAKSTSPTSG